MSASVSRHQIRQMITKLRHATRAMNRWMSREAIAALLGHRSMRMTLTYARISDRTVADGYFRVTQAVENNHRAAEPLPDDATGPNMRLAADHRRLLATATAPDQSPWTASSRPSANAAASTEPDHSSSRSSDANTTTPSNTPTTTEPASSTTSSMASTKPADHASMTSVQAQRITRVTTLRGQEDHDGRSWRACGPPHRVHRQRG